MMFQIDKFGRVPIYEQVIEQTEQLIMTGVWKAGDQLPSVRAMSQSLSVNPNTLQKAYAELERRGVTASAPGNGRFVAKDAKEKIASRSNEWMQSMTETAERMKAAGIPLENVLDAVRTVYGKEERK